MTYIRGPYKLTEAVKRKVRSKYGKLTRAQIAARYGISTASVHRILAPMVIRKASNRFFEC